MSIPRLIRPPSIIKDSPFVFKNHSKSPTQVREEAARVAGELYKGCVKGSVGILASSFLTLHFPYLNFSLPYLPDLLTGNVRLSEMPYLVEGDHLPEFIKAEQDVNNLFIPASSASLLSSFAFLFRKNRLENNKA